MMGENRYGKCKESRKEWSWSPRSLQGQEVPAPRRNTRKEPWCHGCESNPERRSWFRPRWKAFGQDGSAAPRHLAADPAEDCEEGRRCPEAWSPSRGCVSSLAPRSYKNLWSYGPEVFSFNLLVSMYKKN